MYERKHDYEIVRWHIQSSNLVCLQPMEIKSLCSDWPSLITHLILSTDNIWNYHHDTNSWDRNGDSKDDCTDHVLNKVEGVIHTSTDWWTCMAKSVSYHRVWDPVTVILTWTQRLTNVHGNIVCILVHNWRVRWKGFHVPQWHGSNSGHLFHSTGVVQQTDI